MKVTHLKTNEDGTHDVVVGDNHDVWRVELEEGGELKSTSRIVGGKAVPGEPTIPENEALEDFGVTFEIEAKAKISHFALYHSGHGENICLIEMDEALLMEDGYIIDHETATLQPIKNGGMWTLVPANDPTVTTLAKVKSAFEHITKKPTPLMSHMFGKMDSLVEAVALMFGEVEYIVVENPTDLSYLINPADAPKDYVPKTTKRLILGDMIKNAIVASGQTPEDEMVTQAVEEASHNVCESQ